MKALFTMNRLFIPMALVCILGCKKDPSNSGNNSQGTVLLSKIINNTSGDPNFGKSIAEFSYNGKQLVKAIINNYAYKSTDTMSFIYDNSGDLLKVTAIEVIFNSQTGTLVTQNFQFPVVVNGTNIVQINSGTSIAYKYTYNNLGQLTEAIWNRVPDDCLLNYDNNGNLVGENCTNTVDVYASFTVNCGSFDTKKFIGSSLPFYVFFTSAYPFIDGLANPASDLNIDGNQPHNPLELTFINGYGNYTSAPANFIYSYQYNNLGYPSSMTYYVDGDSVHFDPNQKFSYLYQYIQVN